MLETVLARHLTGRRGRVYVLVAGLKFRFHTCSLFVSLIHLKEKNLCEEFQRIYSTRHFIFLVFLG